MKLGTVIVLDTMSAYSFCVQRGKDEGLGVGVGVGVGLGLGKLFRVRIRESVPICMSRERTHLLHSVQKKVSYFVCLL